MTVLLEEKKKEEKAEDEIKFGDAPEKVMEWLKEHMPGCPKKVLVIKGWCKRCGNCISFCPKKALSKDEQGFPAVDNSKCVSCGICEMLCPDFAIVVCDLKGGKAEKQK